MNRNIFDAFANHILKAKRKRAKDFNSNTETDLLIQQNGGLTIKIVNLHSKTIRHARDETDGDSGGRRIRK